MVFHILKIICLNIYELILFFIYTFINNVVINLYAIIVAIYEICYNIVRYMKSNYIEPFLLLISISYIF